MEEELRPDEAAATDETQTAAASVEPAAATEPTEPPQLAADEAPPALTARAESAPAAAASGQAPPPKKGGEPFVLHVPRWLVGALAFVLVAGGFFLLGHFTAGGDDDHDRGSGLFEQRGPLADRLPQGGQQQPQQPQLPQQPQQPRGNVAPANRAVLGVAVVDVGSSEARQLDVTASSGAVVVRVASGSGADKAGIKVGDVITRIGNVTIENAADAAPAVQRHDPGSTVDVVVQRNGSSQTLHVTLGSVEGATTS